MHEDQESRIFIFRIILIIVFALYTVRLFSLQIISGDIHQRAAQEISRRTYVIPAQRGEIFDRNFTRPFVINRDTFAVTLTPAEIPRGRMEEIIGAVSGILGVSSEEIRGKLPSQYLQQYQPVEIAANVPFSLISALAERKNMLPGISWHIKQVRNYINVGSLSHILGYVGDITRAELTTHYNLGYQQGDMIGKSGIERQYDEILRGKRGRETRTVDVRGRRITGQENIIREPPEMGRNLVLTIDNDLQTLVEKAMGSNTGAAVVIRPSTGEVLAMVSYPWYDPNIFTDGISSDFRALLDDPEKPLINRTIQSNYPPASTFKIILSTAIYAEKLFSPDQIIRCDGSINYGGRPWHCHERRTGHGRVNLRRALSESCNIYYMTVGRDFVREERIISYARDYGYGSVTGIDLPGEISGLIPTPQWKEQRFHERWQLGDTMNISIGQGDTLVTPLQMCNLVSMIVNNGKIYKPHVLKEVRDPVTNAIESVVNPQVLHESALPPSVFESIRQDMRSVVTHGTAFNLRQIETAGKTGTAQFGLADRWHLWYTAYAPFNSTNNDDKIAVTVVLEATTYQSGSPSVIASVIFQGYFMNQDFETAARTLGLWHLLQAGDR
ncbi:MAG: penicillin-binding protein 2 [Treponema sp.]|nr:penicillin-binding protein 2 [Treponema sp.]MCL2236625.1 penicillin-binding protein 2 [Treponema sp.]